MSASVEKHVVTVVVSCIFAVAIVHRTTTVIVTVEETDFPKMFPEKANQQATFIVTC